MDFSDCRAHREKAWNNVNLTRLAEKIKSPLVLSVFRLLRHYSMSKRSFSAHVRATTTGSLSLDNCHPFVHGKIMVRQEFFMLTFVDFLFSLCIMEASNTSLESRGGYSNNCQMKYSTS